MQTRKNPRLPGYDYSQDGVYFVTICTADRQRLLGTVHSAVGGDAHIAPPLENSPAAVELTPLGKVVEKYLRSMPGMEKYVVMPDHVHILIRIVDGPMRASAPTLDLPKLVRSFKGLCTKAAGHPIWQRGYYDHIIRDENDFLRCWKYLDENPGRLAGALSHRKCGTEKETGGTAMTTYRVPYENGESEFTEKRSRFISHIWRVETEAEARARIEEMKKRYYDARHNCWCYLLKEGGVVRYSDDGEPQGTAGQPMLNVFQREEVTNVCCVVTRYFGGVLLGAGGLTRAYTRGAKDALDAVGIATMSLWTLWDVPCTYPLFERVKLEIAACGGVVRDADYGADITLRAAFPAGRAEPFAQRLTELSAGSLTMTAAGEEFLPGPRETAN